MEESNIIDFNSIDSALARAAASADASDSHGYLCGLVCAAGYAEPAQWEPELLGDCQSAAEEIEESRRLLKLLYQDIQAKLNDPEMTFQLLLPEDSEGLPQRTEMLGDWCMGFLSGLGMGGLPPMEQLTDECRELLHDFAQISRIEFDLEDPGEEDEVALMEIIEFVRVGVMFLSDELQSQTSARPSRLQ